MFGLHGKLREDSRSISSNFHRNRTTGDLVKTQKMSFPEKLLFSFTQYKLSSHRIYYGPYHQDPVLSGPGARLECGHGSRFTTAPKPQCTVTCWSMFANVPVTMLCAKMPELQGGSATCRWAKYDASITDPRCYNHNHKRFAGPIAQWRARPRVFWSRIEPPKPPRWGPLGACMSTAKARIPHWDGPFCEHV